MTLIDFFNNIASDIKNLLDSKSTVAIRNTLYIPNIEDTGFTLGQGESLNAKTINTCVLFIDIRKSTQLNFKHTSDTLARLYAAFMRGMLKAAEEYGGKVRNINGDRIMIVFDVHECFKNAVNTAILMHSISVYIIDKYFTKDVFSCGIGIDYGEMLVVKTGTTKKGEENQYYKSFVWLGKPANLASKLTDFANKSINKTGINLTYWAVPLAPLPARPGSLPSIFPSSTIGRRLPVRRTLQITEEEFAKKVSKKEGSEKVRYNFNEIISWERVDKNILIPPILFTQEVFDGLQKEASNYDYIKNKLFSTTKEVSVEGYSENIYGGNVIFIDVLKV